MEEGVEAGTAVGSIKVVCKAMQEQLKKVELELGLKFLKAKLTEFRSEERRKVFQGFLRCTKN